PLQEELTLCERYLNIERTRLGERLSIKWDIAAGLGPILVPSLLLQPLLENAVHHGVEVVAQGGWIHVSIARINEQLQIIIENSRVPGVKS
ncbi:alginate biosynthesis protein, partial [Acinetobacter baumannii]